MGSERMMRKLRPLFPRRKLPLPPSSLASRKPRNYREWETLDRWGQIPDWEISPPGFRLRRAREAAGLSQVELGRRLGRSQQAISQVEQWNSNPSFDLMRSWADACGASLEIEIKSRKRSEEEKNSWRS